VYGSQSGADRAAAWHIDNGPGIPVAEHDSVPQRLYRGEQVGHTAASGLRLSIVSAVLRMRDFTMRIDSIEPGVLITIDCWSRSLG
jgi:K+-sensing histidine kinase KdpD